MYGAIIFGFLFAMSLLPIASMQAVLIWNETFSDVMKRRVQVQVHAGHLEDGWSARAVNRLRAWCSRVYEL